VLVLLNWIGINGWNIGGPVRELRLSGPAHINGKLQEVAPGNRSLLSPNHDEPWHISGAG
jgi:hypothetical protein